MVILSKLRRVQRKEQTEMEVEREWVTTLWSGCNQPSSIAKEKKINRWRSQWKNMAILFHLLGMKSNQTMKRNSCRLWTNKTYVCGRYLLTLQMHSNKAITAQNKHYCYRFFWYRRSRIFAVKVVSLEYRSNENQTCKKLKYAYVCATLQKCEVINNYSNQTW